MDVLRDVQCRFGCLDPVAAILHTPQGCVCWPDAVQAVCVHHLAKVQSVGPIEIIVDLRPPELRARMSV